MTAQLLADLKAVRALLAEPTAWTKGAMSRDPYGFVAYPRASSATCWRALGAVEKCAPITRDQLRQGLGFATDRSITEWNDAPERTHSDVIAVLDTTIARIEKEAGNVG